MLGVVLTLCALLLRVCSSSSFYHLKPKLEQDGQEVAVMSAIHEQRKADIDKVDEIHLRQEVQEIKNHLFPGMIICNYEILKIHNQLQEIQENMWTFQARMELWRKFIKCKGLSGTAWHRFCS